MRSVLCALNWIHDLVNKIIVGLAMVLLVLLVAITAQQVFMRFVLNKPAVWSEELAIVLLIWFGYLGIIVGYKENRHMSISFFVEKLPTRAQQIVAILGQVLIAGFCLLMIQQGVIVTRLNAINIIPSLGIPASYMSVVLVIAGVMIAIESVIRIVTEGSHLARGGSKDVSEHRGTSA